MSVFERRNPLHLFKLAEEMHVIRITAFFRYLLHGHKCGLQEYFCMTDAHADQVILKGNTKETRIKMLKMRRADV